MLKTIVELNPRITYWEAHSALLVQKTPEQGADFTTIICLRNGVRERLRNLTNKYHNEQHSIEVAKRMEEFLGNLTDHTMLSSRKKELLIEAAWRHDDDHVGNTYRQLVPNTAGESMSNEEWAVLLMIDEMRELLSMTDIEFLQEHILATSFGQNTAALEKSFPIDPELQKTLQRDYTPHTSTQKLLALADVGGFRKGWDEWVDESLRLVEEQCNCPEDIDSWLKNREGFTMFYIKPLLESLQNVFTAEFYNQLLGELQAVINEIISLKDANNSRRIDYTKKLNEVKSRLKKK